MKWILALRIATSPCERWLKTAAEWKPDLSSRYRTNRAIGRQKKWEDDINDFLKQILEVKENEEPTNREKQSNQQGLDQHCQRLQKMGSFGRKLHKDCVIMTEVKMKTKLPSKKSREDETMTLSLAAAPQPRSALQAAT